MALLGGLQVLAHLFFDAVSVSEFGGNQLGWWQSVKKRTQSVQLVSYCRNFLADFGFERLSIPVRLHQCCTGQEAIRGERTDYDRKAAWAWTEANRDCRHHFISGWFGRLRGWQPLPAPTAKWRGRWRRRQRGGAILLWDAHQQSEFSVSVDR